MTTEKNLYHEEMRSEAVRKLAQYPKEVIKAGLGSHDTTTLDVLIASSTFFLSRGPALPTLLPAIYHLTQNRDGNPSPKY